jgi:hypothetical protein
MLDGLLTWTAHSEHQEVWAGPSWSSIALRYDVAFIWSIKPFISQCGCCMLLLLLLRLQWQQQWQQQ